MDNPLNNRVKITVQVFGPTDEDIAQARRQVNMALSAAGFTPRQSLTAAATPKPSLRVIRGDQQ